MTEVEIKCMQCGLSVDHFLELVSMLVCPPNAIAQEDINMLIFSTSAGMGNTELGCHV